MSEMIDAVAMAILRAMHDVDSLDAAALKSYARAAIAAMREPVDAALWAGVEGWSKGAASTMPYGSTRSLQHARQAWNAVIDEALK